MFKKIIIDSSYIQYILCGIILFFTITSEAKTDLTLYISVDWEGYSLEEHNLASYRRFRDEYPEIKIVHFLNAAYFLKPGLKFLKEYRNNKIKKQIESVIRPGDEFGIHVHATETLLQEASVEFRETETFWGKEKSTAIDGIRGHDVPLTLFTEEEIVRILEASIKILHENGFGNLTSFRAGGWAASAQVMNALAKVGILVDSSAVPPAIVESVMGTERPLYKNVVNKLWNEIRFDATESFLIKTPYGVINEVPNNFGLADYLSPEVVFNEFKKMMEELRFSESKRSLTLHYGFHQETATMHIDRVKTLIDYLRQYVQENDQLNLVSKTFSNLNLITKKKGLSCKSVFNN